MNEKKMKSVKELATLSRGHLVGKYGTSILASILVLGIQLIVTFIATSGSVTSIGTYFLRLAISVIIDLLTGILIYGQCYFYLKLVRCQDTLTASDVFYGFKNNIDKAVMVQLVFTLASVIGTIPAILINLGVIPVTDDNYYGLAGFIYLFELLVLMLVKLFLFPAFYVLCDNPELGVTDILKKSYELMANKKGRLFLTYLSVVPYMILGFCACFVGVIWVYTYAQTLLANFYLDVIGEDPHSPVTEGEAPNSDYTI